MSGSVIQSSSSALDVVDQHGSKASTSRATLPLQRNVRLYLLTWNVGGSKPPVSLEEALSLYTSPLPDMYGIGLQEVNTWSSAPKEWLDAFTWLLADYDYVRVKHRQQHGCIGLAFLRRPLLPYCTSIESEITRTGFGGWWGNKGGVSIRMDIFGTNVIIVNCHLAASQDNVAERMEDYDSILDNQRFKDPDVENILDHDYIFWIGDLNFRIDNLSRLEVCQAVEVGNYEMLLKRDQLGRCMEQRLLLEGFSEMRITFPPTYKFDVGTDTYDTSSKLRIPAWCDRILFMTYDTDYADNFCLQLEPLWYTSMTKYRGSDHKPVCACFLLAVYPDPPQCPVQFERQPSWTGGRVQRVRYRVGRHANVSSLDWIGLYRADFHHFGMFLSYVYAPVVGDGWASGGESVDVTVTFPELATATRPAEYCLCYLTKKYSLMAISNRFKEGVLYVVQPISDKVTIQVIYDEEL